METIKDGASAAVEGVPRFRIAITFCMEGDPGAVMETVQQPADIEAGINRLVMSASLKRFRAMG